MLELVFKEGVMSFLLFNIFKKLFGGVLRMIKIDQISKSGR